MVDIVRQQQRSYQVDFETARLMLPMKQLKSERFPDFQRYV